MLTLCREVPPNVGSQRVKFELRLIKRGIKINKDLELRIKREQYGLFPQKSQKYLVIMLLQTELTELREN